MIHSYHSGNSDPDRFNSEPLSRAYSSTEPEYDGFRIAYFWIYSPIWRQKTFRVELIRGWILVLVMAYCPVNIMLSSPKICWETLKTWIVPYIANDNGTRRKVKLLINIVLRQRVWKS